MANVVTLLGNLLMTNADINYYVQQQVYWSNKYEANAAKLAEQTKAETKWEAAYDSAADASRTSDLKMNGAVFIAKETAGTDAQCRQWADFKVSNYNEELLLELTDLDNEYDSMKTMYETLLEKMRADQENEKQATSTAAQDTGILNG